MVCKNLGKIPEGYKHKQHEVYPVGLITSPELVLKFYELYVKGKPLRESLIKQGKDFLKFEIKDKKINPHSGLGFAILSEDALNVARWDNKTPILLKNQVYSYKRNLNTAELLDISKDGPFCIWELGIVNHERKEWEKYLSSNYDESDKIKYLSSTIEGLL